VVDIVVLRFAQMAPASGDRIVIVRDTKSTCMMTAWSGDTVVAHPECLSLDQMLDLARKEAERLRIATIYVREVSISPRI
jgi:hypothetical protein